MLSSLIDDAMLLGVELDVFVGLQVPVETRHLRKRRGKCCAY